MIKVKNGGWGHENDPSQFKEPDCAPRKAREAMGLKGRDELLVVVKDKLTVILPKPKSHRAALSGPGKGIYSKSYLKKERSSW